MKLFCAIYTSRPAGPQHAFEVMSILETSRRNNQRDDVSGVLFCNASTFVQLLEGPAVAVNTTFQRICRDERHTDVRLLWYGEVQERQFPGWYMRSLGPAEAQAVDFDKLGSGELDEDEIRDLVSDLGGRASARWLGERRPGR